MGINKTINKINKVIEQIHVNYTFIENAIETGDHQDATDEMQNMDVNISYLESLIEELTDQINIIPDNLHDEQKYEIIKELYHKKTLDELEGLI